MRETDHLPIDPLGQLGKAIRPAASPAPDVVKPFETGDHSQGIANTDAAVQTIVDTLRKKAEVTPGDAEEWTGIYTMACSKVMSDAEAKEFFAAAMKWYEKTSTQAEPLTVELVLDDEYTRALLGCI